MFRLFKIKYNYITFFNILTKHYCNRKYDRSKIMLHNFRRSNYFNIDVFFGLSITLPSSEIYFERVLNDENLIKKIDFDLKCLFKYFSKVFEKSFSLT